VSQVTSENLEETIRVAIVEDDAIIRDGLASLIEGTHGYAVVGSYPSAESALDGIKEPVPDVVLMDIELPGISGIEGIRRLRKRYANLDILVLTVHEEGDLVFEALCSGAVGYLTKNIPPARLLDAIRETHSGGAPMSTSIARRVVGSFQRSTTSPLTKRETEILNLVSRGKSYSAIADQLFVEKETVRTHIKNIYRKLEVHSKADAIEKALRDKLI
jgi:DNA-binding NarL/FixJ family response regulator